MRDKLIEALIYPRLLVMRLIEDGNLPRPVNDATTVTQTATVVGRPVCRIFVILKTSQMKF
jgi:hypothetical protein